MNAAVVISLRRYRTDEVTGDAVSEAGQGLALAAGPEVDAGQRYGTLSPDVCSNKSPPIRAPRPSSAATIAALRLSGERIGRLGAPIRERQRPTDSGAWRFSTVSRR